MTAPKEKPQPESIDPFADLSKLRLSQSFTESVGTKKLLTTVPVRKPGNQEFVRVHPGSEYRGPFAWPEHTFQDLLRIAFRERIIDSFEHPVPKRLRGEC